MTDITPAGREARKWLSIAGNISGDDLTVAETAMVDALLGIGHALLDNTAAVREQTATLAHLGGIRDDLADIASAARRRE
jgi:hypothetical protein